MVLLLSMLHIITAMAFQSFIVLLVVAAIFVAVHTKAMDGRSKVSFNNIRGRTGGGGGHQGHIHPLKRDFAAQFPLISRLGGRGGERAPDLDVHLISTEFHGDHVCMYTYIYW